MAESPAKPCVPAEALAKAGRSRAFNPDFCCYSIRMYYVYLLQSRKDPDRRYIGFTEDLRTRITDHNEGKNPSMAPYRPWHLQTYLAFSSKKRALSFEKHIKSGSGHAFARRRLWQYPAADRTKILGQ
jgi:putative endonuclease